MSSSITTQKSIPIQTPAIPKVDTSHFSSHSNQYVSSKSEFSSMSEQKVSQEYKTIKLEHTVPDIPFPKPIEQSKLPVLEKHTEYQICQPEIVEEKKVSLEESGIQTDSISKQSSLQYFIKKINEGDAVPIKDVTIPEPIKPDIYKKFEPKTSEEKTEYQIPITTEEFTLKPESPPEFGFIPKTSSIKRDEFSERVKKITEIQKELPPHEIPSGGVKLLPTSPMQSNVSEYKQTYSEKIEKSFQTTSNKEVGDFLKPKYERPASVASSYSTFERHVSTRPLSAQSGLIEPSAHALLMEKAWAHKSTESNVQKVWPPPEHEEIKFQPSWSTQSTLEKTIIPEIKSETRKETIIKTEPLNVPHYIAEVSHASVAHEQTLESSFTKSDQFQSHQIQKKEYIVEDKNVKPSEIIKSWPQTTLPTSIPPITKPLLETLPLRPISVQDITDEVYLEPGPPPEIAFAEPPVTQRRRSYVETIEQDLEKNLEKQPSKVLPYAVRTIPPPKEKTIAPPLPPKKEILTAPPLPAKPQKLVEVKSLPFEKFPDLEPFPFKPEPEKPKPPKVGPPPTPSKFIKGRFVDSDYESDVEAMKILPKWRPSTSDTEEPAYRKVRAPKITQAKRSRSTDNEPLAPSQFDQPPHFQGPPRPTIDFEDYRLRKEVKKYTKHVSRSHESRKIPSPPKLKPSTPPLIVQPEKKPESPKTKHKQSIDGYMADTDEPFTQQSRFSKTEFQKKEFKEYKQYTQSSETIIDSTQKVAPKPRICRPPEKHESSSITSSSRKVRFIYDFVYYCSLIT